MRHYSEWRVLWRAAGDATGGCPGWSPVDGFGLGLVDEAERIGAIARLLCVTASTIQ